MSPELARQNSGICKLRGQDQCSRGAAAGYAVPTDDRTGLYATPVPELDYISKQQPEAPDEEEPIQQAREIKAAATEAAPATGGYRRSAFRVSVPHQS